MGCHREFVLNVCSFDCDHANDSRGERKVAFTIVPLPTDWRFPPRRLLFPPEGFLKPCPVRVLRMTVPFLCVASAISGGDENSKQQTEHASGNFRFHGRVYSGSSRSAHVLVWRRRRADRRDRLAWRFSLRWWGEAPGEPFPPAACDDARPTTDKISARTAHAAGRCFSPTGSGYVQLLLTSRTRLGDVGFRSG